MKVAEWAKALYAAVFAALTAAVSIYTDVTWLVIVLAAATAVGVYFVPNKDSDKPVDKVEPLL